MRQLRMNPGVGVDISLDAEVAKLKEAVLDLVVIVKGYALPQCPDTDVTRVLAWLARIQQDLASG